MVGNKVFFLFFSFIVAFQAVAADIHKIRSEALRIIDSEALNILNLGNDTVKQLESRQNVITNINSQIRRQGKNIMTYAISEVQDEAQVSFTKATLLNSPQTVFACIFNEGNSGEVAIDRKYNIFQIIVANETAEANSTFYTSTDEWYNNMTAREEKYRHLYSDSTAKIYIAESESEIQSIVTEFQSQSSSFKNAITEILSDVLTIHYNYFTALQTEITTLRTGTTKDAETTFTNIKACFSGLFLADINNGEYYYY